MMADEEEEQPATEEHAQECRHERVVNISTFGNEGAGYLCKDCGQEVIK